MILVAGSLFAPAFAGASPEPAGEREPALHALAVGAGTTYRGESCTLTMATLLAHWDYGEIWDRSAPAALRFKAEGTVGAASGGESGVLFSGNVLALLYLDDWGSPAVRPYVEGGIGVIYTDFQVDGQGLRVNFNPVAGAGVEFRREGKPAWFLALRLHHVSNANLDDDNTGINTVLLQAGFFLP